MTIISEKMLSFKALIRQGAVAALDGITRLLPRFGFLLAR